MNIEKYIQKRKSEDGINEFDLEKRKENTRIFVNYVFEFFNDYLDTTPNDEITVLQERKIEKYRKYVRKYDLPIQEWLVSLYISHGRYVQKLLRDLIHDDFFLLYTSDAEFRALAYQIYAEAVKSAEFLQGQTEMVFYFLKDAYRIDSTFHPAHVNFYIFDGINEWIDNTYQDYGVNIYNFCSKWVHKFYYHPELWPKGHKRRNKGEYSEYIPWNYDYKQKSNLFGLDMLYERMPKKSFVQGKKQELEVVMMYCWLHEVHGDKEYWENYINQVSKTFH